MTRLAARTRVHVEVHPTLGSYRDAWDALADIQPVPTYCLKSWWLDAGVQEEPCFVLVLDGDTLLGGVPLERDMWKGVPRFRTMADRLWPSHFDLIAAPDSEELVRTAIAEWIRTLARALFHLKGLEPGSRLSAAIPYPVTFTEGPASYSTELSGSLDGYLANKSSSFRRDLKRNRRRVADEGYAAEVVSPQECDKALEALKRLHMHQFGDGSALMPVFEPFSDAVRKGVAHGDVEILWLRDRFGVPRVVEVWIQAGNRVEAFAHGMDPSAVAGAGNVLLAFGIDHFSTGGKTHLDLGSHHGEWKERWAPIITRCVTLEAAIGIQANLMKVLRNSTMASKRWMRNRRKRRS